MSETTSRLWIALFVLVVFVCGLSAGFAANAWFGPRGDAGGPRGGFPRGSGPPSPAAFSDRIVERLATDPEFTDDQRQRLEALFAERQDRFRQFNREMRQRFELERESLRVEIAEILTPAQMELLDAARRERREDRRLRRPGGRRDRDAPR